MYYSLQNGIMKAWNRLFTMSTHIQLSVIIPPSPPPLPPPPPPFNDSFASLKSSTSSAKSRATAGC